MPTTLTSQQVAILAATRETTSSLVISACAGTGKTTTLQQVALACPGTGRATSFSRATADELGRKMPSKFSCKTLHADGLAALKNTIPVSITIDKTGSKLSSLARQYVAREDETPQMAQAICALVRQAQTVGIVPNRDTFLVADTPENWEQLATQYDIDFSPFIHEISRELLIATTKLALEKGIVTFEDMLYLPAFFPIRMTQHRVILVDERQDLTPVQHRLLAKSLRADGRIIAAGDEHQAIYGFRGVQADSCEAMNDRFHMTTYPLTVSYRCPKAGVKEAQKYVPEIESHPDAIEGEIIQHNTLSIHNLPPVVLCRNNAPNLRLALLCLRHGIPVEVAGKSIGQGLLSLTRRLFRGKDSDMISSERFLARLREWEASETTRKPEYAQRTQDKCQALDALAQVHSTLGNIRAHLLSLYSDQESTGAKIHFSTIHRAKGKEWPRVLFLDPQLLPSPYAISPWEKQQEQNLAYVGVTRFKETLAFCASKNIQA